jgi:hypothetical protein
MSREADWIHVPRRLDFRQASRFFERSAQKLVLFARLRLDHGSAVSAPAFAGEAQ